MSPATTRSVRGFGIFALVAASLVTTTAYSAEQPFPEYDPFAPGLHLTGTTAEDLVSVYQSGDFLKIETQTAFGDVDVRFVLMSDLSKPVIYFRGFTGRDLFFNYTSLECYAWMGPHDDTCFTVKECVAHVHGESGDDHLYIEGRDCEVFGGSGDDSLAAYDGTSKAYGEGGNDQLTGARLDGGDGDDTLRGASIFEGGAPSGCRLVGGGGSDRLIGSYGNDYLFGGDEQSGLSDCTDNDYLYGGEGVDQLWGGDGNDFLDGGYAVHYGVASPSDGVADLMWGGAGADTFRARYANGARTSRREDKDQDFNRAEGDRFKSTSDVDLGVGLAIGPTIEEMQAQMLAQSAMRLTTGGPDADGLLLAAEEIETEWGSDYTAFATENAVRVTIPYGDLVWEVSTDMAYQETIAPVAALEFEGVGFQAPTAGPLDSSYPIEEAPPVFETYDPPALGGNSNLFRPYSAFGGGL